MASDRMLHSGCLGFRAVRGKRVHFNRYGWNLEPRAEELQAVDPPSVPEPSSDALLLVGILGIASVSLAKRLAAQKA